jgi:putative spermidine/putrescine transport system permease protein
MRRGPVESRRHVFVCGVAGLVLLMMSAPLIVLFGVAVNQGPRQRFPPDGFSLRWFANIFTRDGFIDAIVFSLQLATLCTVISLVIGVLTGLALVRLRFPGRDLLLTFFMSPLIVPQVVVGIAFLIAFSTMRIYSSFLALLIVHTILALPFTIRLIVASLTRFKVSLEDAARSLGASPAKALLLVTLPIIRPGVVSAGVFAFVASFENFTATQFLVWNRTTLPVEIFSYVQTENDPTGAALSSLVVLSVAAMVLLFRRHVGIDSLNAH